MKEISCSVAQTWIVTYVDGSLDAKSKNSLERHLLYCPQCRRVHEATVGLLSKLREDVPAEPPETFWSQYDSSLKALLHEKETDRERSGFSWNVLFACLAASALILAVELGIVNRPSVLTRSPDTLSPQVVEELDRLYGPSLEEQMSLRGGTMAIAAANSDAFGDDALVPWFEVEEDPYPLLHSDPISVSSDRQSSRRLDPKVASREKIGNVLRHAAHERPECGLRPGTSLPKS